MEDNRDRKEPERDEPQHGRFVRFLALFSRVWGKLVQLNLLYLLFCLPVVTIGPATAAMTYVLRHLSRGEPVLLCADFLHAFKSNWKQALAYGVLFGSAALGLTYALQFYLLNAAHYRWMLLPGALTLFTLFVVNVMNFSVPLMIVTLDLGLAAILKNSLLLVFLGLKTNLLTLLWTGLLTGLTWLLLPYSLPLVLLIVPALNSFLVCWNTDPLVRRYCVRPGPVER